MVGPTPVSVLKTLSTALPFLSGSADDKLRNRVMSRLFISGLMAHLIADWLLQNDWMAVNKVKPTHPAGWIHAGIHGIAMLFVFSPIMALAVAVSHWVIDLRFLLVWWRGVFGQAKDGNPLADHVRIWEDQVTHIVVVFGCALVVA